MHDKQTIATNAALIWVTTIFTSERAPSLAAGRLACDWWQTAVLMPVGYGYLLGHVGFMCGLARCELLAALGHAGCICIPNLRD